MEGGHMTDPRLTPETLAAVASEARATLADEPHGNALLSCLLALIEERDALLAPKQKPRMVTVHPQMWEQTQERLAELRAENELLRAELAEMPPPEWHDD
jgi:hypothetical protein